METKTLEAYILDKVEELENKTMLLEATTNIVKVENEKLKEFQSMFKKHFSALVNENGELVVLRDDVLVMGIITPTDPYINDYLKLFGCTKAFKKAQTNLKGEENNEQ